ncbi:MAG: rane-bound metallopeptidase [Hyphomicrobiales bacterium]|nr:rane-bound metallopeptidase [Hyphomicrobiales bacterium]
MPIRQGPGKLLNKALDTQHGDWIKKFSGAQSATDVATLWREALAQGAIPGSYWALLTHPATDAALIRKAFGDVHMLSHLVGAANRADIRRLTELKDQIDVLTAKVERQEARLRDLSLERDEKNTALQSLLSERVSTVSAPLGAAEEAATIRALQDLIQRMHGKLDRETSRRKNLEQLQRNWREEKLALLAERDQLSEAHQRALEELTAVETLLVAPDAGDDQADAMPTIAGLTILFVGGRTHAIPSLRSLIEGYGAYFLHHDGGQAENLNLLPGLIGRADLVLFPIDCISHNAALMLKRLCGQGGKTFLPMPRSGVGSVLRSLISWTAMDADVQGHVSAAN